MATNEPGDGVLASVPPVPARTLLEFEDALARLMDELSDLIPEEGPEDEATKAKREMIEMQVNDLLSREANKVDALAEVMRRFERAAKECADEADRLKKRSKSFDGKRSRLASYVLDVMLKWGAKKLEGTRATFTRIQNVPTVEVDDPKMLGFEFQCWSFTFTPRTSEELERFQNLLDTYVGSCEVRPAKDRLKKFIQTLEDAAAKGITSGWVNEGDIVSGIPEGVRLKPGAWRLAVR